MSASETRLGKDHYSKSGENRSCVDKRSRADCYFITAGQTSTVRIVNF